ncbi:MAG TPA: aminotransferase class V-fold PLP-dependent enzyme [Pirellulales bacterium]|jgi:cysteine desulfurase family protein|nr:aminotransferase class V-fold PLP-dependent enzyme [Pirellulales bacterium]
MPTRPRIYLDQAATSWPKPESVYRAVERYQRENGAAAGRGSYAEAVEAGQAVEAARRAAARFIGADDRRHIVFTSNGTDSLNLAIHGTLAAGGHVVTTVAEHNSVLRPLAALEASGRVEVQRVGCGPSGVVDPDDVRRALRGDTKLVVLTHASNVTGALQPAAEIGRITRRHGALFLLDAAQTLGEMPLAVDMVEVDLLAAPGHKGLLGPLGTGLLFVRPGVEDRLASLRQGGTGSFSDEDRQPQALPDRYESGNLNVPGIVGLAAGLAWLEEQGLESVRRQALELTERLLAGLASIAGLRIHGPATAAERVGVVSVTLAGIDPQELAATLDSAYRIQVRSGLQCAPLMHRALGTLAGGGTVRFSLGPMNTAGEIDAALAALVEIAAAMNVG